MTRIYIFLFILAILGGIGYGAYFIYNDTMQRMAVLRDNNAKLEVAVKAKDSTIKSLQENMEKQIKLTKDLNNKISIAEENNKVDEVSVIYNYFNTNKKHIKRSYLI